MADVMVAAGVACVVLLAVLTVGVRYRSRRSLLLEVDRFQAAREVMTRWPGDRTSTPRLLRQGLPPGHQPDTK
ncbi:MAG: hypothetical protein JWP14_2538 [Frankiales bacterium]|nr:hypothetical protein [Frankiales bacterium]